MTTLFPELDDLGDSLERAVAAQIAVPAPRRWTRRKLVLAVAALSIAVPGIAFATDALISSDDVAASLPAGTKMLAGTEPRCTVVQQDVEYHCVLSRPPAPEISDMKGTVESTVDETKHVNGGCRSLASDGLTWQCYIGQAAVDQKIISAGFLGEYSPTPGSG